MSSYFDTDEHKQLQHQRTALVHCGDVRSKRAEIALIDQRDADGRWHHENPGKTGSWRIAFNGDLMDGYGIPRFETEAEALAYIDRELGPYPKVTAIELPSRQTLDALSARYAEVA